MGSVAASQLKDFICVGFLQIPPPSTSQKHAGSWIGYAKLPTGVRCPEMNWCLTPGVFPPHV